MTLIGATTENPYFEVNSALLSAAAQIYELQAADRRATCASCSTGRSPTPSAGSPTRPPVATKRSTTSPSAPAATPAPPRRRSSAPSRRRARPASGIDLATAEDALQRKAVTYDKQGDRHYDYASALIKSMRGSDPDASLYYLAAMLEGGEDPRFIARRMVILASEDVGNADPQALVVATAAGQAVDRVGLPECALNLAQAAIYLALAPKSNAATRGDRRRDAATCASTAPSCRPTTSATPTTPGAKKLGRGQGYVYPHDEPGGVADQPLLPPEVAGERFYEPTDRGLRGRARGAALGEGGRVGRQRPGRAL